MYPHLQPGYTIRRPTDNDIPAIITVMRAFDIAETGASDAYSQEDILLDWEDLDRTRDIWVVIAPDDMLCAYATLTLVQKSGHIFADGYVHPAHYGRGVGTTLVELMEARAKEVVATQPEGSQWVLVNNIIASSPASCALLETHGYTLARVYFRMAITLDTLPLQPVWPQGIIVRACDGSEEDLHRAYQTIEEGFQDHWAHTPRTFEEWWHRMPREQFDPTLWFLAYANEKSQARYYAVCVKMDMAGSSNWPYVVPGANTAWVLLCYIMPSQPSSKETFSRLVSPWMVKV